MVQISFGLHSNVKLCDTIEAAWINHKEEQCQSMPANCKSLIVMQRGDSGITSGKAI